MSPLDDSTGPDFFGVLNGIAKAGPVLLQSSSCEILDFASGSTLEAPVLKVRCLFLAPRLASSAGNN